MGEIPRTLGPNIYYSEDNLAREYNRIYGTPPPDGATAEQLRIAIADGSGNLRTPVEPESDSYRLLREQAEQGERRQLKVRAAQESAEGE